MGDRPTEDEELVERARGGDVDAYSELVRRHQRVAARVAYPVAGEATEDAVQEAFVKAYRALGRFRRGAPFRPWLLRIVANEARNRRRAAGRAARLALRSVEARPSGDAVPSPEATVMAEQDARILVRALETLREEDRVVIAYRYFADLSEGEMARAMGVPRGTVKSRLSRALTRLRAAMPEEVTDD